MLERSLGTVVNHGDTTIHATASAAETTGGGGRQESHDQEQERGPLPESTLA